MKPRIVALLTLCAGPVFADSLSLDLNNDALRVNYAHDFSRNYTSDFAWIHVKDLGKSNDSGNTFTGGINLRQKINNDVSATIGGKVVFQQHDKYPDGTAMAVGVGVRFTPPANRSVGISGSLYYAPNVLSFGDMNNYRELELRGEYAFSDQLTGYVGYRNNRADYDYNGGSVNSVKLYDGVMVGGEFHF